MLNPDSRIAACNPAALEILGRESGELLGHGASELAIDVVTEDGTPLRTIDCPSQLVLRTGAHEELRLGVSVHDQRRWIRVTAAPLPSQGGCRGVLVTLQDVTVERERELALRRLAEAGQDRPPAADGSWRWAVHYVNHHRG